MSTEPRPEAEVLVVGAGLAGLAAAVALSEGGARVRVLERKPYVGGRAYSYPHPALGEVIDSQHVLLGCCTNLIELCEAAGAAEHIRWYESITFLEPGTAERAARRSELRPSRWAPAPGHNTLSFLRAPMLSLRDKAGIAAGLLEFLGGYPAGDEEAFSEWLRRTRQTERAIRHFWEPVVVGALNDGFERCSTRYAGQVFHESFLKSAEGGRLGIPTQPLSEFYAAVAELAERRGAAVQLRASVDRIERVGGVWVATASDGAVHRAEKMVLALPFEQTQRLLETLERPSEAVKEVVRNFGEFVHAPITTIHLWFDRRITELEHAALLDTRIQWVFNKSLIRRFEAGFEGGDKAGFEAGDGQYLELVISASFAELKRSREEILAGAVEELGRFFPAARQARVVKAGILKEARATFSVTPGLDRFRPAQDVGEGLYLAGDWTRTGWPSTMEGAVRSGRLAAGAVLGRECRTPDLRASGLAAWMGRRVG